MTHTPIANYLERMERYKNHPFRIRDGIGYYLVDGSEVLAKDWEAHNTIPMYFPRSLKNGSNADKTKDYLYD